MAESGMYAMEPVMKLDTSVDLPTCMYTLPVLQVSKSTKTEEGGDCPPAVLKALEARQEAILAKLGHLREEVMKYRTSIGLTSSVPASVAVSPKGVSADVVVRCSPSHPPFSLPALISLICNQVKVFNSSHCHSSVSALPAHLVSFLPVPQVERSQADLKITLIWKEVGNDCELMVSPIAQSAIKGEVNLVRYFARCFPALLQYESDGRMAAVDNMLDNVTSLLWAAPKDRQPLLRSLAVNLGKSSFLCGNVCGIADLALFSALKQLGLDRGLQPELSKWFVLVSTKLMGGKGRRKSRASSSRKSFNRRGGRRASERKNSEPRSDKENSPPKDNSKNKDGKKAGKAGKGGGNDKNDQKSAKNSGKEKSPAAEPKESSPAKTVTMSHMGKPELLNYFSENGIDFDTVEHPEVFTVEAMMPYVKHLPGAVCKNLFLKDKQKNFYLLSAKFDRDIKLSEVGKAVGAKDLRFGDENVMLELLGVKQGAVTAYALVNDRQKRVKFLVDKQLVDGSHEAVCFHPLVNTATTKISSKDFNKFLYLTKHEVRQF